MECLALHKVPRPTTSSVGGLLVRKLHQRVGKVALNSTFRLNPCNLKSRTSFTFKVVAKKQTFTSFDDMISNSELPVLVDFYATWCGPCQLMAPILNQVGAAMSEKVRVVKIDTEKYPAIASRYGIRSLPTFVLFVDGKPIDWLEGAMDQNQLINHIESVLAEEASRRESAAT